MFHCLSLVALSVPAIAAIPMDNSDQTRSSRPVPIGIWRFERVDIGGWVLTKAAIDQFRLTISNGIGSSTRIWITNGTETFDHTGKSWLDPEKCTIDLVNFKGIYAFRGDRITICLGEKRPTEFAAPDGSGRVLCELRRASR